MDIIVNDRKQSVESETKLDLLLSELKINSEKGVAVAVNQQVIPRKNWNSHVLNENDNVVVIKAAQGG